MEDLFQKELWLEFKEHILDISTKHLKELYQEQNSLRKLELGGINYDYSLNHFDQKTIIYLLKYAQSSKIPSFIDKLFSAKKLNLTEDRPVLHMALRNSNSDAAFNNDINIINDINNCKTRMAKLSESIRNGSLLSADGKKIKNIIHIGIGGSELGPKMLTTALAKLIPSDLHIAYLSNLDPDELEDITQRFNPSETIVVIASKSFTTYETLINARAIKNWLGDDKRVAQQCFAITENRAKATEFGVSTTNILPIWSWVGGRYSIWSAVSITVAIAIGFDNFTKFLEGGQLVDEHVRSDNLVENIPLIMALFDVMYVNIMSYPTRAIIPYSSSMKYFIDYIQQLMMESNGKSLNRDGQPVSYQTCPIIWGNIGTNSQHAFHQLLMQGTHQVPIDFIYAQNSNTQHQAQHELFINQCKAQSKALAFGNEYAKEHAVKYVKGNQPQNVIAMDSLTPANLGTLIAIYEYRTMFSGALWNINSFDQFGVELGKQIALEM